ncbi:hypothetical protein EON63_11295 [archaeon]|nr:MAG: hypothetical protein EON63_11295 [archaeon]
MFAGEPGCLHFDSELRPGAGGTRAGRLAGGGYNTNPNEFMVVPPSFSAYSGGYQLIPQAVVVSVSSTCTQPYPATSSSVYAQRPTPSSHANSYAGYAQSR